MTPATQTPTPSSPDTQVHPAWLPEAAFAPVGSRRVAVTPGPATDPVAATVVAEVRRATAAHGGTATVDPSPGTDGDHDLVLRVDPAAAATGFTRERIGGTTVVVARDAAGLLHGLHDVVRQGEAAFGDDHPAVVSRPVAPVRMLDHWDNIDVHPVMGQVERGYSGGSIFYADGRVRDDLSRVADYARLLGSTGINAVAINNVNVHRTEARLLTDGLADVARVADVFRPHGVRTYLAVSFGSPMRLGGLTTNDPLDPDVQAWWAATADRVWAAIPDFGGFVVKADSEGQPGPFAYGRDHADGANLLARAVAPHGGTVFWRAFVYNHEQDWRDRRTDRARAAYDHFAPLDGRFDENVVLQVKYGPLDFQVREAVSPVIAAMQRTRVAVELQVTQEYTGHQKHVCYLGPLWSDVLNFPLADDATRSVAQVVSGVPGPGTPADAELRVGGITAVSNVGDDEFWTGHPLAQANLYAYGRLTWDPTADPVALLDEWMDLTFPGVDPRVRATLHEFMDSSWLTYEKYTAPLGVCFMVDPLRGHYGPNVDGYEYSKWGTYHFADRDGIGVDRTVATGTGFAGQYASPWRETYEDLATCPDELLLFFHHVPYEHVLRSGTTVVQHIYDTRADAVDVVESWVPRWEAVRGLVDDRLHARVAERLTEQVRSATEWRDQVRTYFFRKSGVADASGRPIY